jgi:transposase
MLEGLTPPTKLAPCKVRETLEVLEAKDQEILKNALLDPAWQHSTLTNALRERGIAISESPVRKHRLGRCSC